MKTILFWLFIFALILFGIGKLVVNWGKRELAREQEYDKLHDEITDDLKRDVTSHNYNTIFDKLKKLGQLKWKDKERTSVLTVNFFRKHKEESMKRVKEVK